MRLQLAPQKKHSREEDLYIVNYEFSYNADRNGVVFLDEDDFDDVLNDVYEDAREAVSED